MRSGVVMRCKPYRIGLVLVLIPVGLDMLSIFQFQQLLRLGATIPDQVHSAAGHSRILGFGSADRERKHFVRRSQTLWNANPLRRTFVDSHHLQATITQQTFNSFDGSAGNSVLISVMTPGSASSGGCGGSSATLVLEIS